MASSTLVAASNHASSTLQAMTTLKPLLKAGSERAREQIQATQSEWTFVSQQEYPKFQLDEVTLGSLLGTGAFGAVYEVVALNVKGANPPPRRGSSSLLKQLSSRRSVASPRSSISSRRSSSRRSLGNSIRNLLSGSSRRSLDPQDEDISEELVEDPTRTFLAEHCLRNGGDARYAVKLLQPQVAEDPELLAQGLIDMGLEAGFLATLDHNNIVKLRAVAQTQAHLPNYFIIMDRLYSTLQQQVEVWEHRSRRSSGLSFRKNGADSKQLALYEERMVAAYDLASAIQYLHERKILHRDLKPENVGFDVKGDVKLFDFGLARELHDSEKNNDGTFHLTEMAGTLRYMAPEIANEQPYNEACDVYSFAILLWEMMALKTPYQEFETPLAMQKQVFSEPHKRPKVEKQWPDAIQQLLKQAWCPNLHDRPKMEQVGIILRDECLRVRYDDNGEEAEEEDLSL